MDMKLEVVVVPAPDWSADYLIRERFGVELPS
jgi:hypothetical protein